MKIRRFTPKQTFQWIGCGLRFWKRNQVPWLLTGLLFSISSLAILLIPFVGMFFYAFFLPVIYASMFDTLTSQLDPSKSTTDKKIPPALFPISALFKSMLTEQGALVLFIPGSIAFIVALLLQVLFYVIGGPYTSIQADVLDIGTINLLRLFAAYFVTYVLCMILMAKYFYIVPLCLRDDVSVKAALVGGFGIARKNVSSVSLFLAVLFLPLLLSVLLINAIPIVGIATWIVLGSIIVPLAVHCAYCGNRLTFVTQPK